MRTERPPRIAWLALGGALAATLVVGLAAAPAPEAWRLALTLAGGLAAGSLILATTGRLMSRRWLSLIEDELIPAGGSLAVVALLAVPLLVHLDIDAGALFGPEGITGPRAAWFSDPALVARLLVFLAVGLGAAWAMLRSERPRVAAVALPVLAATTALAAIDWAMLRAPIWWTALVPLGFVVNQMTGALALAFLYHLVQRERGREAEFASLAAALMSLGLLDLWIGYVQFLIAWYGNLPAGAAWYFARMDAAPVALPIAVALQCAGVLLLLLLRRTRRAMLASAALLLGAYLFYQIWMDGGFRPGWLAVIVPLLALWLGWVAALARLYDAAVEKD